MANPWWHHLPSAHVTRLDGVTGDDLSVALEPLPAGAPAVLRYAPAATDATAGDHVAYVLDALDRAAAALFPDWLPGAADIPGPEGAGIAAVRSLAFTLASQSRHFGPFLANLAERILSQRTATGETFPAEVRATGLARVLAASYRRTDAALLFDLPEGLSEAQERAIVSAAGWLAHHGGFGVWLTGAAPLSLDSVDTVTIRIPQVPVAPEPAVVPARPSVEYPPPTGRPHPASAAENALEATLRARTWAAGRAWNQTYQSHPLAEPYRLDLVWEAYRCVVEIDGPDHLVAAKYEADRRRDMRLLLDGYAVLRFTNAQVLYDVRTVASQIEQFLRLRTPREGQRDAQS